MAYKVVNIAWQKEMAKTSTATSGDDVVVISNLELKIDERIVSHFNIPTVAATTASAPAVTTVKEYKYINSSGKEVIVPEHEVSARVGGNSLCRVRVPYIGTIFGEVTSPTARGRARTVGFRFPSFFTVPMLLQAIGTMLTTKQPDVIYVNGRQTPFVQYTAGLPDGQNYGAWCTGTPVTPANTQEAAVGDKTIIKNKNNPAPPLVLTPNP